MLHRKRCTEANKLILNTVIYILANIDRDSRNIFQILKGLMLPTNTYKPPCFVKIHCYVGLNVRTGNGIKPCCQKLTQDTLLFKDIYQANGPGNNYATENINGMRINQIKSMS